jgi:hypothetical protein
MYGHHPDLDACAREWAALRPDALAVLTERQLRISDGGRTAAGVAATFAEREGERDGERERETEREGKGDGESVSVAAGGARQQPRCYDRQPMPRLRPAPPRGPRQPAPWARWFGASGSCGRR